MNMVHQFGNQFKNQNGIQIQEVEKRKQKRKEKRRRPRSPGLLGFSAHQRAAAQQAAPPARSRPAQLARGSPARQRALCSPTATATWAPHVSLSPVHLLHATPRPLTLIPFSDRAPTALAGVGQGVTPGAWPCPLGAAPTTTPRPQNPSLASLEALRSPLALHPSSTELHG